MAIYLRELTLADASVSFKWRNDADVWKFTGSRPDKIITEEIEANWLKDALERHNEKRFAICIEGTGEYIGNVQLTNITEVDAEFHLFIGAKEYWNKSLGTDATKQLLNIAFEDLKLNSVYLSVNTENTGAIKAYERSGFNFTYRLGSSTKMIAFANIEPVTVSVFMITYNHGNFIRQTLQGIVEQKCNFKFDVVIGDDASTDSARTVILEFAAKYPSLFKLIFHPQNIGAYLNQEAVLNNCKGKYVAICEGDDYWTDSSKLQTQVDFLEKQSDYGMVATYYDQFIQEENKLLKANLFNERDFVLNDMLLSNPVGTLTVVFRSSYLPELLESTQIGIQKNWKTGDYPNWITLSRTSKIKILPINTAVYRILSNSASSRNNEKKMIAFEKSVLDVQHHFINKYLNGAEREKFIEITHKRFLNKMYELNIVNEYNATLSQLKKMGYKFSMKEKMKKVVLSLPFIKKMIRKFRQ